MAGSCCSVYLLDSLQRRMRLGEEPAELEEVAVIGRHDAEIVIAVFAIVSTGPGSEEVHLSHLVGFGDGFRYPAELLYRVLSHLAHGNGVAFALYKQGSGSDRSPLPITSHAQHLQQARKHSLGWDRLLQESYVSINGLRPRPMSLLVMKLDATLIDVHRKTSL